jgi:hypothetical protein
MIDNKVSHLNDKKLVVMLFLIDYNHLENCGAKIFDEIYIKTKRHPTAKTLGSIFDIIANDEDLDEEDERLYIIQEFLEYLDIEILKKEKFSELKFIKMEEDFDKSIFNEDEMKTINKIITKYKIETPRKMANVCFAIDKVRETKINEVII